MSAERQGGKLGGTNSHSADDAALGFLYQAQYALLRLWNEAVDDAVIYLEMLDDVTLESNGMTILEQLKHSLSDKPASLTVKSVNVWKTLKAWIDMIPQLELSRTVLNLVTVAEISPTSKLRDLLDDKADRAELLTELQEEAKRVIHERQEAAAAGETKLPHKERANACETFFGLAESKQAEILSPVRLKPAQIKHSPNRGRAREDFDERSGKRSRQYFPSVDRMVEPAGHSCTLRQAREGDSPL